MGRVITNSREIIKRNLHISNPARFGMCFEGKNRSNDFCFAAIPNSDSFQQKIEQSENVLYYDDEWGNVWSRVDGMSKGGQICRPVLRNWDIENYRLPDLANPDRFKEISVNFKKETNLYRMGILPGFPFAICRKLRGLASYFEDLILEKNNIEKLHTKVTELLLQIMKRFSESAADGVFFCEDWGTQNGLLIHPYMWTEIFKPIYKKLCTAAHELGLDVFMHSCGKNWEILDDLADSGIDVFQFDQPALYGIDRLAKKLSELKVCLFSPVDIQKILPTGNREIIENEVVGMCKLFKSHGIGFIAKNYSDLHGIGVKPEWDQWAYDKFKEMIEDDKCCTEKAVF